MSWSWLSGIIAAVALISVVLGLYLLKAPGSSDHARDLGVGLLTSFVISLLVFALQQSIDEGKDQAAAIEKQREESDKAIADEQAFRLSLALTKDLTGFDPNGHSMAGYALNGKVFNSANFVGADLEKTQLRGADISNVDATGANMSGANLEYAFLTRSVLKNADLSNADLEGSKFVHASVEQARSMDGARVNALTCWPEGFIDGFLSGAHPRWHVKALPITADPDHVIKASLGHECTDDDFQ